MLTFDELLARYESGTPAERQQVLDMLPAVRGPLTEEISKLSRQLWDLALRAVFEP